MLSYGDMLDTIERNESQKELTVTEKKGGNNEPKPEEPKPEEPKVEDVI